MEKLSAVVLHYNKLHNSDPSIPAWVVKSRGQTHYVSHVTIEPGLGFSTKETPDNPHTKASIKVHGVLTMSTKDGKTEAFISPCCKKEESNE